MGVDEQNRTIYVEDCATAKQLTAGEYGPSERDPDTLEYEPGYASICK